MHTLRRHTQRCTHTIMTDTSPVYSYLTLYTYTYTETHTGLHICKHKCFQPHVQTHTQSYKHEALFAYATDILMDPVKQWGLHGCHKQYSDIGFNGKQTHKDNTHTHTCVPQVDKDAHLHMYIYCTGPTHT